VLAEEPSANGSASRAWAKAPVSLTAIAIGLVVAGFALEFGGVTVLVVFGLAYLGLGGYILARVHKVRRGRRRSGAPVSPQELADAGTAIRRSYAINALVAPFIAAVLLIYAGVTTGTILAAAGLVLMAALSALGLRR
jgi:hypothetical protein